MKLLDTIKANLKVPHPTLVALGISAGIAAVTVGIFAMADTDLFGQDTAEARRKTRSDN